MVEAFEVVDIIKKQIENGKLYYEFLRKDSMSMGLYTLPAGATDLQRPHAQDEVYYILEGKGTIVVRGEDYPVKAGSIVFVKKFDDHRFHSIIRDLKMLVFFAPAESSHTE